MSPSAPRRPRPSDPRTDPAARLPTFRQDGAATGSGDVTVGLWRVFTSTDGLDSRIQEWASGRRRAAGQRPRAMVSILDAIRGSDALADLLQTIGGPGFTFDRSVLRTQSGF